MDYLNEGAERVQNILSEIGHANKVIELPDSARTAQAAADALGCDVAQIAKSIIFRSEQTDMPILVVASGVNRVNEKCVSAALMDKLGKADADFVRERTGFVIGGVSPIGHLESVTTIIDEDLFLYETIWAAAGHPKTVFELTASELAAMSVGKVKKHVILKRSSDRSPDLLRAAVFFDQKEAGMIPYPHMDETVGE